MLLGADLVVATTINAMLYAMIGKQIIPKAVLLAEIDVDTSIHSCCLAVLEKCLAFLPNSGS